MEVSRSIANTICFMLLFVAAVAALVSVSISNYAKQSSSSMRKQMTVSSFHSHEWNAPERPLLMKLNALNSKVNVVLIAEQKQ